MKIIPAYGRQKTQDIVRRLDGGVGSEQDHFPFGIWNRDCFPPETAEYFSAVLNADAIELSGCRNQDFAGCAEQPFEIFRISAEFAVPDDSLKFPVLRMSGVEFVFEINAFVFRVCVVDKRQSGILVEFLLIACAELIDGMIRQMIHHGVSVCGEFAQSLLCFFAVQIL